MMFLKMNFAPDIGNEITFKANEKHIVFFNLTKCFLILVKK